MVKETICIMGTRIEMKKENPIKKGNQSINDIRLGNRVGLTRDLSKSTLVDTTLKKSDKNGY